MARKLVFLVPAALFAVLLVAFAIGLRHDPHLLPSALIDRAAPDFALPGLYETADGLTRKDLGGRVTLVNFFASWCAPCREEHAELMYPEVAAHLMRVTETAHWLEWQDWANPILAEPFRLENGHLLIPDRPGNGIEWDEDAIKRYRLDA